VFNDVVHRLLNIWIEFLTLWIELLYSVLLQRIENRLLAQLDAFDARQNILGGTLYLRVLLDLYGGDISLMAAAYNAGEEAVARYNGIPPFKETQGYVRTVNGILAAPTQSGASRPFPALSAAPKAPPRIYYRWKDDKGVVHMEQSPPAVGEYVTIRSAD
jgi:hypothetical protein